MGRLIDARNLNFDNQHYNKTQMKAILDFIDSQPTAYDVDKVVEAIKFKQYFDELYGTGLEVANWHLNGDLEPFDNFYESALEEGAVKDE